ncbi:MAG: 2-oxo acid dehydrogenase subunit E2 [Alphaproteobacteria bacterium]|nr:2-oxo acid dehydrogenase subunit E2 [Alphaproteobacteria bacterium]
MAMKIGMPNLGHTMESGKVVEWLKPLGARVSRGDPIAVVESDKVSIEVESPGDGTILLHAVEIGAEVAVGTAIAFVGDTGDTLVEAAAARHGTPAPPDHGAMTPPTAPAPVAPAARRILASPLARSTALRLGVDLRGIDGTGPDDLVVRADVERAAARARVPGIRHVAPSTARRRIAERMARAWREVPMVPLTRHVDVTRVDAARRAHAPATWTALFARALAITLPAHPRLNAWYADDSIREVSAIDLAVAVALDDGLAVPVLRAIQSKSLASLDAEIGALAAAARDGTLQGQAQADGTFTLSNLGATGVDAFQPIINQPQVAILAAGRVRATGDRREVTLTLVFDHRALDGETGARFLADLAGTLGDPDKIFT